MAILSPFSLKYLVLSSLAYGVAKCQTTSSSASRAADGLVSSVAPSSASVNTVLNDGVTMTYRAIPTLDSSISNTPPVLPNIFDPQAVNAQTVCPGYTASNVVNNMYGFTARLALAGKACNVYGTDIESLNLIVQYQSANRLSVKITPTYLVSCALVHKPAVGNLVIHAKNTGCIECYSIHHSNLLSSSAHLGLRCKYDDAE